MGGKRERERERERKKERKNQREKIAKQMLLLEATVGFPTAKYQASEARKLK